MVVAANAQSKKRDLNQFAGKTPIKQGGGAARKSSATARKASVAPADLPSTQAPGDRQVKSAEVPAGLPASVTEQMNAQPAAPQTKPAAKAAPAKS